MLESPKLSSTGPAPGNARNDSPVISMGPVGNWFGSYQYLNYDGNRATGFCSVGVSWRIRIRVWHDNRIPIPTVGMRNTVNNTNAKGRVETNL